MWKMMSHIISLMISHEIDKTKARRITCILVKHILR